MKAIRASVIIPLAILLIGLSAQAQTPDSSTKQFAKDGLVFDYPDGWTVVDQSNQDAQQLTLARPDSDAQIRFFVHRGKVDTPEKMTKAKSAFIDPYIKATNDSFVQMGAKPERSDASVQIGSAQAEGVRLRASLGGEQGEAAIYWLTLGNRVVVITFFGPDKALQKAAPAWEAVRNSLRIEEAKPAPKPTPK
ncbi:MAG TPA: hypothetical protein VF791_07705 [Pyrinomonadaceae bacterium]